MGSGEQMPTGSESSNGAVACVAGWLQLVITKRVKL
jgi:hypothetical protein